MVLEGYICSAVEEQVYITGLDTPEKRLVSTITNQGLLVYNSSGTQVSTGNIKTGYVVKTAEGDILGTIIYFGDVNGDELIDITDAFQVLRILSGNTVEGIFKTLRYSGDVNHDGIINRTDASIIQDYDLKLVDINQNAKVVPIREYINE